MTVLSHAILVVLALLTWGGTVEAWGRPSIDWD
jgi:hypothetical protein